MGEGYRYIGLGKSLKGTITLREDEETRPKKKKSSQIHYGEEQH